MQAKEGEIKKGLIIPGLMPIDMDTGVDRHKAASLGDEVQVRVQRASAVQCSVGSCYLEEKVISLLRDM